MTAAWLRPEFARPEWLWLLVLLPLVVLFFRRSLVDLPKRQMVASLVTRLIILVLLIAALAELSVRTASKQVFAVFAVDCSLSVDQQIGQTTAVRYIRAALDEHPSADAAVLPFAAIPGDFSGVDDVAAALDTFRSDVTRLQATNLQAGVSVAAAAVPSGYLPHVVLLTDGNETAGDVLTSVAGRDVRVSTVPLPVRTDPEIQVTAVNAPHQVPEGEPFRLEVVIDSNCSAAVVVDVFQDDFLIASEQRQITAGENRFFFTHQVKETARFTARVRPPDSSTEKWRDSIAENNSATGIVLTRGQPRVLLVDSVPEQARHLKWAMQEEGIQLEVRPPAGLPQTLAELQKFDALILSDVPATDVSMAAMETIRRYVRDLGGGFLMLGGDDSFGLGGYYRTVIEEILPVRCDVEKEKEKPGLAMVIVMDKSGSMGGHKLQLAKEAAAGAVELLSEKDQIGVIAFDGSPYWVSELRPCTQKTIILDRIASIEAGGGTSLYPAMEEAYRALKAATARLKHVIILTDGYSTPGDFEAITREMVAARITVSTVGIGDADQALLQQIAQLGEGRYYFSDDASSVPQIFARETLTASRSAIKEEPFLPVLVRATPVLQGIDFDNAPFLLGHVVTRPKPTSEVILATETGDPLLVWWRYGLGMSIAFTSDARSQWAAEWLTWDGFNRFWAQVIRHALREPDTRGFDVQVTRRRLQTGIVVDALDENGQFVNNADTQLRLINPDGNAQLLPMTQTAPGRYEAQVATAQPGTWHMQIVQTVGGKVLHQHSHAFVVGYPDEYRLRPVNDELLRSVAHVTAGTFDLKPAAVFRPPPGAYADRMIELWPALLTAAMILFVLDVALRRLDLLQIFSKTVSSTNRIR